MLAAARLATPVIVPRAVILWGLIRLAVAMLPLGMGEAVGSISPSPVVVVLLCGAVGLIDIGVRGERILWANLGVTPAWLYASYATPAIVSEWLMAVVLR